MESSGQEGLAGQVKCLSLAIHEGSEAMNYENSCILKKEVWLYVGDEVGKETGREAAMLD